MQKAFTLSCFAFFKKHSRRNFTSLIFLFCFSVYGNSSDIFILKDSNNNFNIECINSAKQALKNNNIQTVFYEYEFGKDTDKLLTDIAASKKPVVLTMGDKSLDFAATTINPSIPVVFCMVFSNNYPAHKNFTGVTVNIPSKLRLSTIKDALAGVNKIGTVYSSKFDNEVKTLSNECETMGMNFTGSLLETDNDFYAKTPELVNKLDCFLMLPDPSIYNSQTIKFLIMECIKTKIPLIGLNQFFTQSGAVLSIECDYSDIGTQAGEILGKICSGSAPETIKQLNPRKIKITINMLAAEKMGITVSQKTINLATKVFR